MLLFALGRVARLLCLGSIALAGSARAGAPSPLVYSYDLGSNRLVSFQSDAPGSLLDNVALSGLAIGESLLGIDFRPQTGRLHGIASNGTTDRIVRIDPESGAVTSIGVGDIETPAGSFFGIDFNPVADRIRRVSEADVSQRLNPITEQTFTDTPLFYAAGDSGEGQNPAVVHVAYTDDVATATVTTLYGIDVARDVLVRIGGVDGLPSPNVGILTTVGPLAVDAIGYGGFDIEADTGLALAALRVANSSGLYTINLTTGAATSIGAIGTGTGTSDGLAIAVPEAQSMAACLAAVLALRMRRT